jgi:hypothetical protein
VRVTILYSKSRLKLPLWSWIIRIIEADKITQPLAGSHISFCAVVGGETATFESTYPVSSIITADRWKEKHELIYSWDIEATCSESEAMAWMLEFSNKKYSMLQCLLIGLGELFGGWVKTLVRKQNPNGSEYLICVEAVVRFLIQFAGFKFDRSPDIIGLKEFITRMDEHEKRCAK